jgi:hypothetical protein
VDEPFSALDGPFSVPVFKTALEKGLSAPQKAAAEGRTGRSAAEKAPAMRPSGPAPAQKAMAAPEKARVEAPKATSMLRKAVAFMENDKFSLDLAAPVKPMAARRLGSGLVPVPSCRSARAAAHF